MKKTFTLRIDLESDKGIRAVPRFLDLLNKYNLKASFYLVMGGESGILDLLRYKRKLRSSGERKIKVWSLREKLRMAFSPKDFVVDNAKILRKILEEGHELGLHGWKHREWTRGLEKIDINERISISIKKYEKIFGKKPISFAAPGFNTNKKVLDILEEHDIKFMSDFQEEDVKKFGEMKNVPITILGENKTPIIEYLVSRGKNDEEIVNFLKKKIKSKRISSFYVHDLFELRFKLKILEEIFKFVTTSKIRGKRVIDY